MGHEHLARARTSVVLPVELATSPGGDWLAGPLELPLPGGTGTTSADARRTYFDDRAARVLYGHDDLITRWHRTHGLPALDGLGLTAVELLDLTSDATPSLAVLVLHLEPDRPGDVAALRPWLRLKHVKGQHVTGLRKWVVEQLREVADVPEGWGRALTMTYAEPGCNGLPPGPFGSPGWTDEEEWLLALAACATGEHFAIDSTVRPELLDGRVPFSADWGGLVLRDGIALLARRARDAEDARDFLAAAEVYAATIYTDVLVLGLAQQVGLATLADQLAQVVEPSEALDDVLSLEAAFSAFRNTYWWQHLTQHGPANQLLDAFHSQRRLPELVSQVGEELADYARQAELREARRTAAADARTNRFLALLAIVGLPLALAPVMHDLLPADVWWRKPLAAAAALVALAFLVVVTEARTLLVEWWRERRESSS